MAYEDNLVPINYTIKSEDDVHEYLEDMATSWRPRIPVVGEGVKIINPDFTSVNFRVVDVVHETWYTYHSDPFPVNRVYLEKISEDI